MYALNFPEFTIFTHHNMLEYEERRQKPDAIAMGLTVSKLSETACSRRRRCESFHMAGLDAAAKTTILHTLKLGKSVNTIPAFVDVLFYGVHEVSSLSWT